ncbi:MAG TPA: hypothetical protein VNL70_00170 [Tepidisphaeraceae bacterium]|nr:hypothetical protein [Tepidisphaeraceae bacterium]
MGGPAVSRGQIYLGDGYLPALVDFFGPHPPGSIIALGLPDGLPRPAASASEIATHSAALAAGPNAAAFNFASDRAAGVPSQAFIFAQEPDQLPGDPIDQLLAQDEVLH